MLDNNFKKKIISGVFFFCSMLPINSIVSATTCLETTHSETSHSEVASGEAQSAPKTLSDFKSCLEKIFNSEGFINYLNVLQASSIEDKIEHGLWISSKISSNTKIHKDSKEALERIILSQVDSYLKTKQSESEKQDKGVVLEVSVKK